MKSVMTSGWLRFVSFWLLVVAGYGQQAFAKTESAMFAGGCFWCVEAAYQDVEGVVEAVSGFTGGTLQNPTYAGNHQGHYEAVKVTFNPQLISYQQLLEIFWRNIDPFDDAGQFCDKGPSYRTAIFADERQMMAALASKRGLEDRFEDQKIVTEIRPATTFWPVEAAHQDYYKKNPLRYRFYRLSCGRDNRLEEIWGTPVVH